MIESSLPAVLRERASLQPNDLAFTFMDYDTDPEGVAKTLTWAQLYQQSVAVAHELRQHGEIGDRVVIVAPQCLEYVVGFLGALEAGMIAVPLTQPIMGHHDERVISVMKDAQPVVALTTAASIFVFLAYGTTARSARRFGAGDRDGAIAEGVRNQKKPEARLDIEHIADLSKVTGIPLVLHGGSGSGDENLARCARGGVAKVNLYTDFIVAALAAVYEQRPDHWLKLLGAGDEAMREVLRHYYRVLGCVR